MSERRFEEQRELLQPLMETITDLGRLPEPDEFRESAKLIGEFGSIKRAFALVRRVTGEEAWESIRTRKVEDLLIYLALGRFRRRPPISRLPLVLQRDIRTFFGTYKTACDLADELLFQVGDADTIDKACRVSSIGKLFPNALYIHRSALEQLCPLLRVFEGCARMYIGEVSDATVLKLHRFSGKVSYLAYPRFENDPHPSLLRGVKVALRSREVSCYEYSDKANPPVLHRKETMLHTEHPLYEKFARLSAQEERHGLLDESATIGTRDGWNRRLEERGFGLRGHRLVKIQQPSDSSPLQAEGSSVSNSDDTSEWLSSTDARAIMRLSSCDLAHLRESGTVRFRKKGNAFFYSPDDCQHIALERRSQVPAETDGHGSLS